MPDIDSIGRIIMNGVRQFQEFMVTADVMARWFPLPDQRTQDILVFAGHRPEPTPDEQLARICALYDLEYWYDARHNLFRFRRKQEHP